MNVQMRVHILRTFVTHLLVHIHQKTKIALEISAKIASINRPLNTLGNSKPNIPSHCEVSPLSTAHFCLL
jgi:hypothetical protein